MMPAKSASSIRASGSAIQWVMAGAMHAIRAATVRERKSRDPQGPPIRRFWLTAVGPCASGALSVAGWRTAASVMGFAALTALGAQVRVPLPGTPVPMTLQLFAVLLAGFCLRPACAAAAMGLYLAAGLVGAPVFALGSAGLLGPTGGYLAGFVLGAAAMALSLGNSRSLARQTFAGVTCVLIVFACGVAWQVMLFGMGTGQALGLGVLPFVPKAIVELCLAVSAARLCPASCRRRGPAGPG